MSTTPAPTTPTTPTAPTTTPTPTTPSIFREQARRYHRERDREGHFPRMVSPRVFTASWLVLAIILALLAGTWLVPVPEYVTGEAVVFDDVVVAAVAADDRIAPGQDLFLGSSDRGVCRGRVADIAGHDLSAGDVRALAGPGAEAAAGALARDHGRLTAMHAADLQDCPWSRGAARGTPSRGATVPLRIAVAERPLAALLPFFGASDQPTAER